MSDLDYDAIARAALGFVLEDESWPVFLAWCRRQQDTEVMREWTVSADVDEIRALWLANSADPFVRRLAGFVDREPEPC